MLRQKIRELRAERDWTQAELAKRAGLGRGYISNLEGAKVVHRPSAEALLKLARAFNIKPEELYEAAGYIKELKDINPRPDTPEELLDKLRLATPQRIPVYAWEYFPFHAGEGIEPTDYVYRSRAKLANKNIEAYIVHGDCLNPQINDGDVIIVDREGVIDNGDIVACLIDNKFNIFRVRKVAGEVWVENNNGKFKFIDCQHAAPVIECIRRLK